MKWISVKEKLPEKEDEYLVISKDGNTEYFCLHMWGKKYESKYKKTTTSWGRCLQESYDHPYECGEITYWMPLPPKPGKE